MASRSDKEQAALAAAERVFTRYGFVRTTMGDIAAEAAMSRPALYLLFADKEAIFAAVIAQMDQRAIADIRTQIALLPSRRERLHQACGDWGSHGVALAAAYPDSADLFDLRFAAVRQAYAHFQALLVEILGDTDATALSSPPDEIARSLTYGMRGLRETARDVDEMRRLIRLHVDAYAWALDAKVGGNGSVRAVSERRSGALKPAS
ncbi:TetR/AcrR family transcriptional regulator [Rhizobium sp. YIM 134829]|uniref:TetR/AcrR family transcriptional regulator n=1 Tax=Rhizobium sp. YIM 134829 TaxID=3390453 RepID=UPI0039798032